MDYPGHPILVHPPPQGGHRVLVAATAPTRPQGIEEFPVGKAGQNPVQTPEVRKIIGPVPGKQKNPSRGPS